MAGLAERKTPYQASNATVSHLRTHDGQHEVDLIVRGPGGRVVAIESKLSATPRPADVAQLNWLHERVGDDLAAKVILTAGKDAYTRKDGVAVVPAALLGP
ncbi:MAG: DUF4143 domain-containing protein [Propionibacteriaceae bacterium]|nr:DUF4143 domain-containing protein [Propionibacteriaceae bacterium]